MAQTSTNKLPLLADRPLLSIQRLDQTNAPIASPDPGTGTTGALLVDCTSGDGAIIDAIWLIQRVAGNASQVSLFIGTSNIALGVSPTGGQADAWFIGRFGPTVGGDVGDVTEFKAPKILAPAAFGGSGDSTQVTDGGTVTVTAAPPQYRGLHLAKGFALWAAVYSDSPVASAPNIACQGGWY